MCTISPHPSKMTTFDFRKNSDKLPIDFMLKFKKSKNNDTIFSNYSPIATGSSVNIKSHVQTKLQDKKYLKDIQINLMELNIIKNYHKIFKNEEGRKYTNEYIKNISSLLHKNEEDYFSKRRKLDNNKTEIIKKGKTSLYYIPNFSKRLAEREKVEENKKKSLIQKPNNIKLNFNGEERDKYSLNNSYNSNESLELTKNQDQKIKKNLIEQYNFFYYVDKGKSTSGIFSKERGNSKNKNLPIIRSNLLKTYTNPNLFDNSKNSKSSGIFVSDFNNKINFKNSELNKTEQHIKKINKS